METEESPAVDANERRSGYLGFVAHEVRNPLSTALWTAELLTRMSPEERGGARGDKLSAMCLRSLSRVRQIVEDHFLCERLDVAGIPVRAETLVLGEVIDTLLDRRPGRRPARLGRSRRPDRHRGGPVIAGAGDRCAAGGRGCRWDARAARRPSGVRSRRDLVLRAHARRGRARGSSQGVPERSEGDGRSRSRSRGASRRRWGVTWSFRAADTSSRSRG